MASDIEFRLPEPGYEDVAWVHNEHLPGAASLLERTVRELTQRTQPDGLPGSIYVNGYSYSRDWQMPPSRGPFDLERVSTWQERLFPGIERARLALDGFDPASVAPGGWAEALQTLNAAFDASFGEVHRDTMGVVLPASARWIELHAEQFGADRRDDALALLAGFPNTSTARTVALWDLSRIAADDPEARTAVEAGRMPESAEFLEAFGTLIAHFGDTTAMHLVDLPTWREDATIPLAMVAAMAREPDDADPHFEEERALARRLELEAGLADLDDDARAVLAVAQQLSSASEDHNLFCDQRLIAAMRRMWLHIGDHLVALGRLDVRDHVFAHSHEELLGALERGEAVAPDLLAQRTEQQARWRAVMPPGRLGLGSGSAEETAEIGGIAASAGRYRGRARVVASLEEAWRIEPGDVLVCSATAPEWTPYFGVIGALVTGAGGVLTHGAVVAREFGIPAVVGVGDALLRLVDGADVTVDGSAGTVTIEADS